MMNHNETTIMADTDFDRERFEELAAKAESNDLSPDEIEELNDQIHALNEVMGEFIHAVSDVVRPLMREVREAMRPMAEFAAEHPEVMNNAGLNDSERESLQDVAEDDPTHE